MRGAWNRMSRIPEADRGKGVVAFSSGNHAQGVAFAAQSLNAKAHIVMPATSPLVKVLASRRQSPLPMKRF
jgi:threonine dehydratase